MTTVGSLVGRSSGNSESCVGGCPRVGSCSAPLSLIVSFSRRWKTNTSTPTGTISIAISSFFAICFFQQLQLIDFPNNVSECEAREIFLVGNRFFLVIFDFLFSVEEERRRKIIDALKSDKVSDDRSSFMM